jgi:hypothetical protein
VAQEKHEIKYHGPANPSANAQPQKPLSPESARVVALSAWRIGRLRISGHFTKRVKERKFDILDVEQVIRHGTPKGGAVFCKRYNNYKYVFHAAVDGIGLRAVFAIDATQDYTTSPLVILITAAWSTKTGARKR